MYSLFNRTEYSFGTTYAPIDRVAKRIAELGFSAAAVTDTDNTWAHTHWRNALKKHGVLPLYGISLGIKHPDKNTDILPRAYFIARTVEGLKELYRFSTLAHSHGASGEKTEYPYATYWDVENLSENVLSFCGDVTDIELIQAGRMEIDVSPKSRILNTAKLSIAKKLNRKVITPVSDNSYAYSEDSDIFELMPRSRVSPTKQYILSQEELLAMVPEEYKVFNIEIEPFDFPQAPMIHFEGDLRAICLEGKKSRIAKGLKWTAEYEERLEMELRLIKEKDFESYFLIVADMVRYAKQHMLVGPSRGSAAGSLVCYLSGITEIDPLPPGLYFERFIDVSRSDLPDIDLDFPGKKRELVFQYMRDKYGESNVSQIGTVLTYKPRSALIQAAKKLNVPPIATYAVKIAMIERSSADARASACLLDTLTETNPGIKFISQYPQMIKSADIEGHASHTGKHAAGLIVSNESINNYATVTADGIVQLDKVSISDFNLLKIDVLGLKTLDVLEESHLMDTEEWYLLNYYKPDKEALSIFNKRALCGIFQFEGEAMRSIAERIEFNTIDDINSVTALARPGPFAGGVTQSWLERRAGAEYNPIHPLVEDTMKESYGLPIFQEQTLAIVRNIGKFDWKDTSTIRKAMSKSLGDEFFAQFWEKFKQGAKEQGINEEQAHKTWYMINSMGSWQMNKAHTFSYAVISYWTAYFKAKEPEMFAAATLSNNSNEDSNIALLREMVEHGMKYGGFDPNKSDVTWSVKEGVLYAGFDSIHGYGEAKAKKLIKQRINNNGSLPNDEIDKIKKLHSPYKELWPMGKAMGKAYQEPNRIGINLPERESLIKIGDFDGSQNGSYVFIGYLVRKSLRDVNEAANIKKRNGKRLGAPYTYLDIRIADDTGQIIARIDRFKYRSIGESIFENTPEGTIMLIRAKFIKDIRFAFITKIKQIADNLLELERMVKENV